MVVLRPYLFATALLACVLASLGLVNANSVEPRRTIEQLTSIFENSSPILHYTYCKNIHDHRGLTFGYAGFTSGTYDGTLFLREYQRLRPGNPLVRYLPAFQAIDAGPHDAEGRNPDTTGLRGFPTAFRHLGGDPAFRQAQENLVDRLYWAPSQRLARHLGAHLPLTQGELYDTCINHGADGLAALVRATTRALGGAPVDGIPERTWLAKFLALRLALLRADTTWRHAVDRVRVYQRLLTDGNVRLKKPIHVRCYRDSFTLK